MHRKKTFFIAVIFINLSLVYANPANSITYKSLDFKISNENVNPELLIDEFVNFVSSDYVVQAKKEKRIIKYDWKKYLYFENNIKIQKQDMSVKISMDIQQQQPYLFYRKKNNDYFIYFHFTRYCHEGEKEDDVIFFLNELDKKIDDFIKEHNWIIHLV